MAITYSWHISQLNTIQTPEPDTVDVIKAYLYGKDENGHNTTVPFELTMPLPDSYEGASFIEYNKLTEDKVIGWLTDYLAPGDIKKLEDLLDEKIAKFYENNSGTTEAKPTVPW